LFAVQVAWLLILTPFCVGLFLLVISMDIWRLPIMPKRGGGDARTGNWRAAGGGCRVWHFVLLPLGHTVHFVA
jgi:hypothetical protein